MSTDLTLPSDRMRPAPTTDISQATAVEQARAVAEVQAAVVVAQQVPRNMSRAVEQMRDTCTRTAVANRAFYSVPKRGNGPTVHLARELARIWGNVQYGVHELRRDDDAGTSEVQAFAWDVETNVRSTRTFIVPHERMVQKRRTKLTDLGDVYLNNQNIGARAVRECIFTVLPDWYVEEAQGICHTTLERGDGESLTDRIAKMVAAFEGVGVKVGQLEAKAGRPRGQWTGTDVVNLGTAYSTIQRGEAKRDDLFPPQQVTAEELGNAEVVDGE